MIKLGIKKIEYRADSTAAWRTLETVSMSAELSEKWSESDAGKYSTVTVTADIRNSSKEKDIILDELSNWFFTYRVTDMNGRTYIFGSNDFRANFTYSRNFGGLKANGYSINIVCKSPDGIKASY